MALKERKIRKEYSLDEMMAVVNLTFITEGSGANIAPLHFVITPTCLGGVKSLFLVCDSRENQDWDEEPDDLLPCYYGATLKEAITKCFDDRANHNVTPWNDAVVAVPVQPQPIHQAGKRSLFNG